MPIYYQACKGSSPTGSGVDFLGLSLVIGPSVIVAGASIKITKRYRIQLWIGWVFTVLGMGVLTTLHADTPLLNSICLPILLGIGSGIIYASAYFPVLAPLPVSENAHALAFFSFGRSFAGVSKRYFMTTSWLILDRVKTGMGCHHRVCCVTDAAQETTPNRLPLAATRWCLNRIFCHSSYWRPPRTCTERSSTSFRRERHCHLASDDRDSKHRPRCEPSDERTPAPYRSR